MEVVGPASLLEALGDDIDGLEEALAPLINETLADAVSKLPLLDKAQLFALVTYAVETMLYCKFCSDPILARVANKDQHIYDSMVSMPRNTPSS